jgi:hypothetical protein
VREVPDHLFMLATMPAGNIKRHYKIVLLAPPPDRCGIYSQHYHRDRFSGALGELPNSNTKVLAKPNFHGLDAGALLCSCVPINRQSYPRSPIQAFRPIRLVLRQPCAMRFLLPNRTVRILLFEWSKIN